MTPQELKTIRRVMRIFMPHARREIDRIIRTKKRFAHYTTAENAFNILSSKALWMRNTNCMSDYREVQHGHQLLVNFFQEGTHRVDFCAALNACFAGIGEQAILAFDQSWHTIQSNTYIASVSEHDDSEDEHGRLSMWRAFGQQANSRAALVMNMPQEGAAEGLKLIVSPVAYFSYPQVKQELLKVIKNITLNTSFLRTLGHDRL